MLVTQTYVSIDRNLFFNRDWQPCVFYNQSILLYFDIKWGHPITLKKKSAFINAFHKLRKKYYWNFLLVNELLSIITNFMVTWFFFIKNRHIDTVEYRRIYDLQLSTHKIGVLFCPRYMNWKSVSKMTHFTSSNFLLND